MTDRGERDIISDIVHGLVCEAAGCDAKATRMVGADAWVLLCEAHRALALVKDAHTAIVALAPEDRARFDEIVEAWARESGQG